MKPLFSLTAGTARHALLAVTLCCAAGAALAQTTSGRKEISRVDLSGAPGMEVVSSISEYKPGDELPAHFHHGIETGIWLQGGAV